MKKTIIGVCLAVTATACLAQTAGDRLGSALRDPLPGASMPDRQLPIYLRAGSLVCEKWQRIRSVAEDAARADGAEQARIVRNAECAIVPEEVRVDVVNVDQKSWEGTALRTYGLAKIRWQESSGINDVGFVGLGALRN